MEEKTAETRITAAGTTGSPRVDSSPAGKPGRASRHQKHRPAVAPCTFTPDNVTAAKSVVWHSIESPVDVLIASGSTWAGLTTGEARRRHGMVGSNRMTPPKGTSAWKRLFDQINSIIIYILIIAGTSSIFFEHYVDAGVIYGVVVANVSLGFFMEAHAEKAAQALSKILASTATVIRDGKTQQLPADQLTIGDLVKLKAGEGIPADVRLIESSHLQIEEAALTGESAAVFKDVSPVADSAGLADRTNMAYWGTSVMAGSARAVVVAVGDDCEVGKINTLVGSVEMKKSPLLRQLQLFGRWMTVGILIIGCIAFGIAMGRGYATVDALNFGISIAVALIPEGLPTVITVILAIGVQKMSAHRAIVRQLPAVETLGSVSVICSDKTGTLTQNAMTAVTVLTSKGLCRATGTGYTPIGELRYTHEKLSPAERKTMLEVLLPGMLCNDSIIAPSDSEEEEAPWTMTGNPTEASLLTLGMKVGLESLTPVEAAFPRLASLPFDSQHKFMATLHGRVPPPSRTIQIDPNIVRRRTMDSIVRKLSEREASQDTIRSFPRSSAGVGSPRSVAGVGSPLSFAGGVSPRSPGVAPRATAESTEASSVWDDGDLLYLREGDSGNVLMLKGAPESVLPLCSHQLSADGLSVEPFDITEWRAKATQMAAEGLRVLALCSALISPEKTQIHMQDIIEVTPFLTLHCLVGIFDPPREQAKAAVSECQTAGIRVIMITGDHPITACIIGRQLNLHISDVLTGPDVEGMSDEDLAEAVMKTSIFARATPEHKLRIVKALQSHKYVAAMTGDGVNDAPALKQADIGVAMGITGTHVAKAASNMILVDDNFATIVEAVRRGRAVYDNLTKVLLFMLPSGGGQSFSILLSIVFGLEVPIIPVQILWVNLITAITLGIVLAFDPASPHVMNRPPRRRGKRVLGKLLSWRLFYVSLVLSLCVILSFAWEQDIVHSTNSARTVAVNTLSVCQIAYIMNCRYMRETSMRKSLFTGNSHLLLGIAAVVGFQILFTYVPGIQDVFQTEPQDGIAWLRSLMFGVTVFLLVEVDKFIGPKIVRRILVPLFHRCCQSCKRKPHMEPQAQTQAAGPRSDDRHDLPQPVDAV